MPETTIVITPTIILVSIIIFYLFFGGKTKNGVSEEERQKIELEAKISERVRREMLKEEKKRDRDYD